MKIILVCIKLVLNKFSTVPTYYAKKTFIGYRKETYPFIVYDSNIV